MATGRRIGKYVLGEELGSGAFATVKIAQHAETDETFAIKIIRRDCSRELALKIKTECAVMKVLKHPNIVQLKEVLATSKTVYMVLEYCPDGELYDTIVDGGAMEENRARRFFQQLIDAIHFCHLRGVYHRDLKPENLLLADGGETLKVADFGMSNVKSSTGSKMLSTCVGSEFYCAPEIRRAYEYDEEYDGSKVDIWSCGVLLYLFLTGYLPFDEEDPQALADKVERCEVSYPDTLSPGATDLLRHLLVRNPKSRFSTGQIRGHPWFQKGFKPARLNGGAKRPGMASTRISVNPALPQASITDDETASDGSPIDLSEDQKGTSKDGQKSFEREKSHPTSPREGSDRGFQFSPIVSDPGSPAHNPMETPPRAVERLLRNSAQQSDPDLHPTRLDRSMLENVSAEPKLSKSHRTPSTAAPSIASDYDSFANGESEPGSFNIFRKVKIGKGEAPTLEQSKSAADAIPLLESRRMSLVQILTRRASAISPARTDVPKTSEDEEYEMPTSPRSPRTPRVVRHGPGASAGLSTQSARRSIDERRDSSRRDGPNTRRSLDIRRLSVSFAGRGGSRGRIQPQRSFWKRVTGRRE